MMCLVHTKSSWEVRQGSWKHAVHVLTCANNGTPLVGHAFAQHLLAHGCTVACVALPPRCRHLNS